MNDLVTAGLVESWMIFEQLIKNLPTQNYAHDPTKLSANYRRNQFALSAHDVANLDLFCYIRNAIVLYNGAYHAAKDVDCHYRGHHYESSPNIGKQIDVGEELCWHIMSDIEAYAVKAWDNWTKWRAAHP